MTTRPNSDSPFATPPPSESAPTPAVEENTPFPRSTVMQRSPQLSSTALTRLLIGMCMLPIITIMILSYLMPPVAEGQLKCQFSARDLPSADFYAIHYRDRDDYELGELVVHNQEDQDWTHLNILVNGYYQIYDSEPIPAKSSKAYKLDRFVSRAGARFQLRYNPLKSARIYARRPTHDRATWACEFKDGQPIEPPK